MSQTKPVPVFPTLQSGDLNDLAEVAQQPCVSILMQTHPTGRETQQDPIRLKNLLGLAREQLHEANFDDSLLDEIESKFQAADGWPLPGQGLAIYRTPDDCRTFLLGHPVDDTVAVDDCFRIAPLIGGPGITDAYFILSLTWEEASLYRADSESVELVETENLPAQFDDLVLPRDPEESLQQTSHRSLGNAGGSSTTMFHGHGEGEEKIEADRQRYLSLVGDLVGTEIYNTKLPLVIVATAEVAGHFQAATEIEIDATVEGSPSNWSVTELHERARAALAPLRDAARDDFLERFGTANAHAQGSADIDEILTAATNGRVESLMIGENSIDDRSINEVVIATLRNGGTVFRSSGAMPVDDAAAAAIFRY